MKLCRRVAWSLIAGCAVFAAGLAAGCQANGSKPAARPPASQPGGAKPAPTDAMAGNDADRAREDIRRGGSSEGYRPSPPDDRSGNRVVDQPRVAPRKP